MKKLKNIFLLRTKYLWEIEIKVFEEKKRVIMYTNFFCKHSKEIMMRFYHLPLLSIRIVTTCLPVWKQLWTSCLIYPSYFFPTLNQKNSSTLLYAISEIHNFTNTLSQYRFQFEYVIFLEYWKSLDAIFDIFLTFYSIVFRWNYGKRVCSVTLD